MEFKRVVITGVGTVNPLGNTVNEYWDNLKNGVSGAAPITNLMLQNTRPILPVRSKISTLNNTSNERKPGNTTFIPSMHWLQQLRRLPIPALILKW
jgi:3-oxoacyl-(acyl-carrier-protein) synthase